MAHLPNDELPNEFEVIVHGTGLSQCILAAAISRAGKSVLHLDGHSFYGELWGTLMHSDLESWLHHINDDSSMVHETPSLEEEEKLHQLSHDSHAFNVVDTIHKISPEEVILDSSENTSSQIEPVTWESFGNKIRRFNYDIMPKLLYCRGELVDVIVQSGVSRYMEFKAVPKLYFYTQDNILQVPCSRSDVFNSKIVTMLEKRKMMKFLSLCSEYEQHHDEYEMYIGKPFVQFLVSQDLSSNLVDYITYSIAFVDESTETLQGLKSTQLFLQSLGRFGNAPFLYPIFGSGEIPQAFCRLCAVFGGVYCLKRSIRSIVTTCDNRINAIICTSGQRIKCSRLISSVSLLKNQLNLGTHIKEVIISRAIFITNGSINNVDEKINVITIPPNSTSEIPNTKITILQLDSSTHNTLNETCMIHMSCVSHNKTAQQDLQSIGMKLFNIPESPDSNRNGPILLRSLYYNIRSWLVVDSAGTHSTLPGNVTVTSDPDPSISYEACINEAKTIFHEMYPGEEFLPKIPDPEDIVYEDEEINKETPVIKESPITNETVTEDTSVVEDTKDTPVIEETVDTPVVEVTTVTNDTLVTK